MQGSANRQTAGRLSIYLEEEPVAQPRTLELQYPDKFSGRVRELREVNSQKLHPPEAKVARVPFCLAPNAPTAPGSEGYALGKSRTQLSGFRGSRSARRFHEPAEFLRKYKMHLKIVGVVIGGQPCFSDLQNNTDNSSRI